VAYRRLDFVPDLGPRLDRSDHLVQHTKPVLPLTHHRREILVCGNHGLGLRALVGIESAEGILRGEHDMVVG
jgi:hypothetical protein